MKPRTPTAYLDQEAQRSVQYIRPHFRLLAWTATILYPLGYLGGVLVEPNVYHAFLPRFACVLLALPFLGRPPNKGWIADYEHWYAWAVFTFGLPFLFGHVLLANAANQPIGGTGFFLLAQYLVALFIYVQLTNSLVLATLGWLISSATALVLLHITPSAVHWEEVSRIFLQPVGVFLTAILVGSIANRNVQVINEEKSRAIATLGNTVAHEVRTPLLAIRVRARGALKALEAASSTNSGFDAENLVKESLSVIDSEVELANTTIEMLLVASREKPLREMEFEKFGAIKCSTEAIRRYPFSNDDEAALVRLNFTSDFEIVAPKLMVIHVLFNLIKNSLSSVQRGGFGAVALSVERDTNPNEIAGWIRVRDTGPGISPDLKKRIFHPFYSSGSDLHGSGIGLSFCHRVMNEIGGTIVLDSKPNSETTFSLGFPSRCV